MSTLINLLIFLVIIVLSSTQPSLQIFCIYLAGVGFFVNLLSMPNFKTSPFTHIFKMLFIRLSTAFTIVALFIFLPIFSNPFNPKKNKTATSQNFNKNDKVEDLIPLLSASSITESLAQSNLELEPDLSLIVEPLAQEQSQYLVPILVPTNKKTIVRRLKQITTQRTQTIEVPISSPKPITDIVVKPEPIKQEPEPIITPEPVPTPLPLPLPLPVPSPTPLPLPVLVPVPTPSLPLPVLTPAPVVQETAPIVTELPIVSNI